MGEEALYVAKISQYSRVAIKDKCTVTEDILYQIESYMVRFDL